MEAVYQQTAVWNGGTVSDMLHLLQECASAHQTALGTGREEMLRRGLLWMITRQKLVLERPAVCGERITVTTWLSGMRHGMLLRHYEMTGADGAIICRALAVWTLVDAETRTLAQAPLSVPLVQREGELSRFPLLHPMETVQGYPFTVPHAYVDENGHMNNARYFDAVAPILPKDGTLHSVQVDYHREACEGETLVIGAATQGKTLLVQADGESGLCFRMKLEYE